MSLVSPQAGRSSVSFLRKQESRKKLDSHFCGNGRQGAGKDGRGEAEAGWRELVIKGVWIPACAGMTPSTFIRLQCYSVGSFLERIR